MGCICSKPNEGLQHKPHAKTNNPIRSPVNGVNGRYTDPPGLPPGVEGKWKFEVFPFFLNLINLPVLLLGPVAHFHSIYN